MRPHYITFNNDTTMEMVLKINYDILIEMTKEKAFYGKLGFAGF